MSRTQTPRFGKWLIPLALLAVASGLAITTGAPAHAGEDNSAVNNPKQSPAAGAPQGSGAKNVYSQNSIHAVPTGPDAGRQLFVQSCSTCHGVSGGGTEVAPPVAGAGAAKADFYLSTGRMPAEGPTKQANRRHPTFSDEQRAEIVQYVASLAKGPPIPPVDPSRGDLVQGNLLYSTNCAACHHATGSGGAVGRDYFAPGLNQATPLQVAEAIRSGPGTMPVFNNGALNDDQVNSIARYVEHLKTADHPGGYSIGSLGPFSEGFIGWIVGLGALLGLARWIGSRD